MQFTWYWHSLTTVVVQHADLKHNFEEYETYSLGWKVVEIHEDIKFNIQTNFLHYLVTFTQGINWIERDKYMNKNTSIITKHHSFWWLIIKSAGNFHNLVPKKSNNISQILWLIIKTPQVLMAGNKNQQGIVTNLHTHTHTKSQITFQKYFG